MMLNISGLVYASVLIARCVAEYNLNSGTENFSTNVCPPGFGGKPCQCKANHYNGLYMCDSTRAYVRRGYWVGECRDGSLCTGNCPLGFCNYNKTFNQALPTSYDKLEEFICGIERQGVLCGECQANYSVRFHSYTYRCGPNTLCKFGILFYFISELMPLTILFVLVMVSNLSFTSGALNGFILFAQLQDSLAIHGNGVLDILTEDIFVTAVHRLIYRFVNFEFFSIEVLSFCLWENATVLDAMAFKYMTIVYALLLVLICVIVMSQSKIRNFFNCLRPKSLRSATIHGLTTFFVMCYSQCARVSIQILGTMHLYKMGPAYAETVLFRSGHLELFEQEHLKYGIPAIFFACFLLIPPPLILIFYPLAFKVLGLCKLSETKPVNRISKYIPIQLLDSFQSCFKDEFRFFAGLYFLYRVATMVVFVASRNLTEFYITLEFLLIIALSVHCIVQPYKKRWHNVIDSLLFANLAIINGISLYHFLTIVEGKESNKELHNVRFSIKIQVILIYIPLVVIAIIFIINIFKKVKDHCISKNLLESIQKSTTKISEDDLPPLRDTELTHYRRVTFHHI